MLRGPTSRTTLGEYLLPPETNTIFPYRLASINPTPVKAIDHTRQELGRLCGRGRKLWCGEGWKGSRGCGGRCLNITWATKSRRALMFRLLEPGDCQFRYVDLPNDVRLAVRAGIEGVVNLLPVVLQHDERFGEVSDFCWKLPHRPALQAGASGPAMLVWNNTVPRPSMAPVGETAIPLRGIAKRPRQRSPLKGVMRPVPRRTSRSADEQVGGGSRQTIKHSVICGADRSAKPRLSEAFAVGVRQAPCGFHRLMRVQGCASPGRIER